MSQIATGTPSLEISRVVFVTGFPWPVAARTAMENAVDERASADTRTPGK